MSAIQFVATDGLTTRPPFDGLFPIEPRILDAVQESMAGGFDASQPLIVWREADDRVTVIDGHTRLRAAQNLGLARVPVYFRQYRDEDEALADAIRRQRDRRNLTEADLLRCIAALDERKRQGERTDLAGNQARFNRSSEQTAELLGIGRDKVERARTVLDHGDADIRSAVLAGEMSINRAYQETQERRRHTAETVAKPSVASARQEIALVQAPKAAALSTFNRTNDNVDWAWWTWNPVTGCLHDCPYCYARDIANRFYPQKFVPTFHEDRLAAPRHTKMPDSDDPRARRVFTCSMADLFGKWVPQEWIDAVFEQVRDSRQWEFLFLTKFPQRLAELEWPDNAWVGTTVDRQHRVEIAEKAFRGVTAGVKWLSCEPMLEPLTFTDLGMFDLVVIGGATRSSQTEEFWPPFEWIVDLYNQARASGCKVYLKPNALSHKTPVPKETPRGMSESPSPPAQTALDVYHTV